jgi:heterodisulfide reductase subunit A
MKGSEEKRIGVFVCHCGNNIADTVDVKRVTESLKGYPGVQYVTDYRYMCSNPGQDLIKEKIESEKLDGVVVAACSPTLHESTFRVTVRSAGMNPYMTEIANIREQCSWVHRDREIATEKALRIITSVIQKTLQNEQLEPISVPVNRRALVIGGGIAGIQAALSIANSGYNVLLVEKEPSIGGHMAQLSETFPTLDCSQCILTPKMVEVSQHERIRLITYSEVEDVSGFIGNFTVKIRKKAKGVDWELCNGCGVCMEKCPATVRSEFDRNLGTRKAIYRSFPQAVPNKVVIDRQSCLFYQKGKCKVCEKFCPPGAVSFDQEDEIIEEEVGAIVVATGFELFPIQNIPEYGMGKIKDVIDGLTFERLLSASGPTGGEVKRPSDGNVPKEVVFIECVCSRDPERYFSYCSKVCCMYTAKHALLYRHSVHEGRAYVFYIDIRAGGKDYEEFVQRTIEEQQVLYLRGRVSKLYEEDGKVVVCGTDTLTSRNVELRVDLVVLATAMRPSPETERLAKLLGIGLSEHGFLTEAHPKLRPVESLTAGIYLAGCGQAPRDIPDTVSQASAAASMVSALFSSEELQHEPLIAGVDDDLCSGCGICVSVCPYGARKLNAQKGVVEVNEVLCEGCGACSSACPSGAAQQHNYTDSQITSMVRTILSGNNLSK